MDELWSGVAVVGAPAVEREQGLGHGGYTLAVFAGPMLFGALIEAAVMPLSDRVSRRRFTAAALALLGASLVVCALATNTWMFSAGLSLAGAASGAACGTAQAGLLVVYRGSPERAMARWTLFAAIGDVLAPLLVAAVLAMGWSYRVAVFGIAILLMFQARTIARDRRIDSALSSGDGVGEPAPRDAREGPLRRPWLWAWLFGASICTLLDEMVAALISLRIRQDLGGTETLASAALAALSIGSVLGAAVADRILERAKPLRVMAAGAVVAGASLLVVAGSRATPLFAIALVLLGASASVHYPVAKARAYATAPERPGLVNAMAQVFVVLDIAAPVAVGAIADRWGLSIALASLLVQPVTLLALAAASGAADASPVPPSAKARQGEHE
jgi:MFS family permease